MTTSTGPEGVPPPSAGLIRALIFLGALALVGSIGALLYASTHPAAQRVLAAGRGILRTTLAGISAPGTEDLVAAGCENAMVSTVGEIVGSIEVFLSDEEISDFLHDDRASTVLVMCKLPPVSWSQLRCGEVAATYASAVFPESPFIAMVRGRSGLAEDTLCSGYYSPAGERLGSVGKRYELVPDGLASSSS